MPSVIRSVTPGSPAALAGILPGGTLLSVNGHGIEDVLDYQYYTYDPELTVVVSVPGEGEKTLTVRKEEGEPMGLDFEDYLMDKARSCANHCLFCFVDQLPKGLRKTLYFKDDDSRLSFLTGSYITLTNLSEREIQRICDLRISPIRVSVHAVNPELRRKLLQNERGGEIMEILRRFSDAGITVECQIVCCPGLNDGEELTRSMEELAALYPSVESVSVVPVGLTKYRAHLPQLTPFDQEKACAVVDQVEGFGEKCLEKYGSRIFFCADELYLKAGRELPEDDFYEGYPQLENGVGMLKLLETEFTEAMEELEPGKPEPFTAVTGVAAAPYLRSLIGKAAERYDLPEWKVAAVENDFFGHTIDVAGLVTGRDLIAQLRGRTVGGKLLIPVNMLRHGETVFLDDVSLDDVERELGVAPTVVPQDGRELLKAVLGL